MRQTSKYVIALISGVTAILAVSCGTSTTPSATPSFTIKGRGTAAARHARPTTAGSPTTLNLTLYAVYISPNTDCSGAVLAGGDGTTAVTKDMVTNPTIFSSSPAAGTYKCLIMKMSDNMVFKPDATAAAAFPGVCTAGTDATFDIHRAGETWKNMDGSGQVGTGSESAPGNDTVFIFASTVPADVTAGAIGADSTQIVQLGASFTIPATGTYTATFTTDFSNRVSNSSGHCWLEAAPFTITGS